MATATFFLAVALLVAVAVVSIAVTVLQTKRLSDQRKDWDEEIMRFRGELNAVTKRKMDNVVRAYALQVDTGASRRLNNDDRAKKIRWVTQKHRVYPDMTRWEVVDVNVETARWMLVKKDRNSTQLSTDVVNGDVRQLVLGGEIFEVRVISDDDSSVRRTVERLTPNTPASSLPNFVAFQVGKTAANDGPGEGTTVVHKPFVGDAVRESVTWAALKSASGGVQTDASMLVHAWGYGVRRGAPSHL